jgi:hypothetical protein
VVRILPLPVQGTWRSRKIPALFDPTESLTFIHHPTPVRQNLKSTPLHRLATVFIAGVWIFHGLYSKILNGIPRHKMIVGEILGDAVADAAVLVIGVMEILLGCWVLSGLSRRLNATVQTLALVSMNTLEILLAREFLISAGGMVLLNLCFIALIWWWATRGDQSIQPH